MQITKYKSWFFDCDGVLLDSNLIKTEAFYEAALPYGAENADSLVSYHKQFGGVSRFAKFQYFFEHILGEKGFEKQLEKILTEFGLLVRSKLLQCPETEGLVPFLKKLATVDYKIVISGGMQDELQYVFAQRGLSEYFDAIYGSPDTKLTILQRELDQGSFHPPAVFVGDSQYDYECADKFDLDFIFMHQYTEFTGWHDYFSNKDVNVITNLGELTCQAI